MTDTLIAANDNQRLLTLDEAALDLGVCKRTIVKHISSGELAYIVTGAGHRRLQRKIHPNDLRLFIDKRRRFDCQFTSPAPNRRITTSTSKLGVTGFMAQRDARLSEKRINSKR